MWLAGDIMAKGFLLGATAGRTTLNGEGLQHEDGHSLLLASAIPNLLTYDAAFAYEIAVIIQDGMKRMCQEGENIFYYLTLYNENYPMPPMPEGAEPGILKGLYKFKASPAKKKLRAQILGSGPLLRGALQAQEILAEKFDVEPGVFVAVSDCMKMVPDQIAPWVPGGLTTLGTDGFGRSDTRENLRRFFEVDAPMIVVATLHALAQKGAVGAAAVERAIKELKVDPEKVFPAYG